MAMKPECAVVIGMGQLGRVFSAALLANGNAVIPVLRDSDMQALAGIFPEPVLVLVATGEAELHPVLEAIPQVWRDRLGLLQNELLPRDWQRHGISDPTVIPVWFEKKQGSDVKPLLPTPVYGPASELVLSSMSRVGIPGRPLDSAEQLTFELVLKNLYILTINIAGLRVGGDVDTLWTRHREFAEAVFDEILAIQEALTGGRFSRAALLAGMDAAIAGDPQHQCTGRSAPVRLRRALEHADALGLATPLLRDLARLHG
ncbi:hypothetical protein [Thermithiobacillus plumbiphilus]|uniref:Ketopantoate reductase n=1 Tax=Thermithiobacillus plumbiphilus TaxID=1729899 RepID=A0ABU9D6Y6_9PROT